MNKQCLKTTLAAFSLIVGGLMSACANSGGQYGREHTRQVTEPEAEKTLTPTAVEALGFEKGDLAVVFAVDKNGNIHTYTTAEGKKTVREFPLPAGEIEQMDAITTFKTSNPKVCWLSYGTLSCVSWP